MIEIVLLLVIFSLVGLIGFMDYNNRKERAKFLNALMSKNNQEFVNAELTDKTKIEIDKPVPQDIVPLESVTDEEFMAL